MRISATVTRKGQVTIPAAIRLRLGLDPHGRIDFVLEDGEVRIVPAQSVTARTAGALRHAGPALSPRAEKDAAESAFLAEAESSTAPPE